MALPAATVWLALPEPCLVRLAEPVTTELLEDFSELEDAGATLLLDFTELELVGFTLLDDAGTTWLEELAGVTLPLDPGLGNVAPA